jgi:hypothetical protein
MTRSRKKTPNEKHFTKRRTVGEGLKLADAAHGAVWRLYCDVFGFWRARERNAAGTGDVSASQPAA